MRVSGVKGCRSRAGKLSSLSRPWTSMSRQVMSRASPAARVISVSCALVALATLRAAPFYRVLGYAESAVYFRGVLDGQARK